MDLIKKINKNNLKIGVIGLGYVGLPLAMEFAAKGNKVLGFEIDESKVKLLQKGRSYIKHIPGTKIKPLIEKGTLSGTTEFSRIKEVDVIIIAVPTPLNEHREPDITFIKSAGQSISRYMKKGQLIVLESSTYPGTTDEILKPLFENCDAAKKEGKKWTVGKDFFLSFSPEREDPNNPHFNTATIPKVVGGSTKECLKLTLALYDQVIVKTVPVSSTRAAEATKLLENIYRSVNIALVNELKMVFDRMGIDVWEVIDAAKTKPFGFQAFYPGPGLGGHCIPIDPFYLTWKAREYDVNTKFIELAGEINTQQPYYVVERTIEFLNENRKSIKGSKILILGAAYKKDIDDLRESPSLKLIDLLRRKGSLVDYSDPNIPKIKAEHGFKYEMNSVELTPENIKKYDLILLSTDHSDFDYSMIAEKANLIIDTRNAFGSRGIKKKTIFMS